MLLSLEGFLGAKNLSTSLIQPLVSLKFPLFEECAVVFLLSLRSYWLFRYTVSEHLGTLVGNEISPNTHRSSWFHGGGLKNKRCN
jgi:hypothetical protein